MCIRDRLNTVDIIGKTEYSGTFDGQNHTISGLYMAGSGLFNQVSGTVKNLNIADSFVGIKDKTYVGGIASRVLAGGTIESSSFTGLSLIHI